jgi:NO-binding membrane sensor protein with MHYT domain
MVSCLGAFLGLRCVTRARAYEGPGRATWLALAAVSVGGLGIWAMHFIAMLGFSINHQQMTYSMSKTVESLLLAIIVVGVGLFIVGYGDVGWGRLLTGGMIVGFGVAAMHYLGMAGMQMSAVVHYNLPLVALSVVIAVVAGTAALWAGVRLSSIGATVGAVLIMGVAVTGMHYTGMAALRVTAGATPNSMTMTMAGTPGPTFVVPLVVGLVLLTSGIVMVLSLTRTEEEIAEDKRLRRHAAQLEAHLHSAPRPEPPWSRAERR